MRDYKDFKLDSILKLNILILIFTASLGCTESEMGIEPDDNIDTFEPVLKVDSLLIGAWKHRNFPSAIVIDSIGTVNYYIQNQVTGEFEKDGRFTDKIRANNGSFKFLETSACAPSNDSTYIFDGIKLRIPIKKSYQSVDVYYDPIEIETYTGARRSETNYIKADVTIDFADDRNAEGVENISHQFDSSDEFELMELFTAPNPGSFISAYASPSFTCNHPIVFHHRVSMITDGPIESTGTYELVGGMVQFAGRDLEFGNTYNLSYDNNSAKFETGQLTVTSYSSDENTKQIEGFFEYFMTSEWNGLIDTVTVKNGILKISEFLE